MDKECDIMYSLSVEARPNGRIEIKVTPDDAQVSLGDLLLLAEYARDTIMQQLYLSQQKASENEV